MNLQPNLENEFIRLRPLYKEDFEALYQVAKDPLIWERHPNSDRHTRAAFRTFFQDSIRSKAALIVLDKQRQKVIGSSRFNKLAKTHQAIEIGWSFLARAYWGGKYNKAIKVLMMDYAFQFVEDVVFYIGKANIRSQKAVEKLGATQIMGLAFQNLLDERKDNLTYRINIQGWKHPEANH